MKKWYKVTYIHEELVIYDNFHSLEYGILNTCINGGDGVSSIVDSDGKEYDCEWTLNIIDMETGEKI